MHSFRVVPDLKNVYTKKIRKLNKTPLNFPNPLLNKDYISAELAISKAQT
jgi:hypothetical protein